VNRPAVDLVLLVCGNVYRRDDGAAVWAVAGLLPSLRDSARPSVGVRRCDQLDIEDLLGAAGSPVVIVDAAAGLPPGAVITLSLDELAQPQPGAAPRSSHAVPIAQVLGVARLLADAPIEGLFVGIGGADFGFGRGLSPVVRAAIPEFAHAIEAGVAELAAARSEVASG
jgi:hydrogenase maturation protease